jgi:hypothetical protein
MPKGSSICTPISSAAAAAAEPLAYHQLYVDTQRRLPRGRMLQGSLIRTHISSDVTGVATAANSTASNTADVNADMSGCVRHGATGPRPTTSPNHTMCHHTTPQHVLGACHKSGAPAVADCFSARKANWMAVNHGSVDCRQEPSATLTHQCPAAGS